MIEQIKDIDWEQFHFLRNEYLYGLCIALLVLIIGFLAYRQPNTWKKHIAKHLQPYVIIKGNAWRSRLIKLSVVVMFVIGIISFLGPTWSQIKAPAKKVESKLVIALDLSNSMLAEDISPNRLERAKFKIHDFLSANPAAQTNLLVFAGSTHTAVPFTTDYRIIEDQINGLKPNMMPVKGSSFSLLFEKVDSLFYNNKAEGKVLLITDDLEDLPLQKVSNFLQQNNVKLYLYPIATQSGATIPKTNQNSALNLQRLNSLKALAQVEVVEMTLDKSDVEDLAQAINKNILFEDKSDENEENWQDNGYWLLIPLALIFLFSFRKGWSLNSLVILIVLSSCGKDEKLVDEEFQFKDLWYTKQFQAQQAYDKQDYIEAAQGFQDNFRKGVAYYKSGDYLSAEMAFKNDTTTNGNYNLGLTYTKLGKLELAKIEFEKVLDKDPENSEVSNMIERITGEIAELKKVEVNTEPEGKKAKNKQNDSPEDLSGGGQEATKKDMEKERTEETQETDTRKGKELDELPEDFKAGKGEIPKNVLLRKVDDDPALFLTKKFRYQVKKKLVKVEKATNQW